MSTGNVPRAVNLVGSSLTWRLSAAARMTSKNFRLVAVNARPDEALCRASSMLVHGHASALSCRRDMAVQLTDDVGNISPCCTVGGRLADKQIAICRSGLGPPASAGNGLSITRLLELAVQVHCQLRLQRPVV